MDIPTLRLPQAEFDALRVLPSGEYNQDPPGRFLSSTGQWVYIGPGDECAVIEIRAPKKDDAPMMITFPYDAVPEHAPIVQRERELWRRGRPLR